MMSIVGSYSIIKKNIDFTKPIIIRNFIDQEIILQEWADRLEKNYYANWPKSTLFLRIFEDLEIKSVLKSIFDYVKSCYLINFDLRNDKKSKEFYKKIEHYKENIIIRELILDYEIKIAQEEINNFQIIMPEIDAKNLEHFLLIKKLQNFMLNNFNWKFNYDVCLNYINKKFSYISLDENIQGFSNWQKFENWLNQHELNFLGKKFNQNISFYLWQKNFIIFVKSKKYIECCQKWNIQRKYLNIELREIDSILLKDFLVSFFCELANQDFFDQYQKIFINSIQEIIEKCPEYPIKKLCKTIVWIIFENYIFYDCLNKFYVENSNKIKVNNKTINAR